MPNPARGEVAFSVPDAGGGERSYTLRFGNNELVALQQALGFTPIEDLQQTAAFFVFLAKVLRCYSPYHWRILLCEGLRRSCPEITVAAAGDLLDALGRDRSGDLVAEALSAALKTDGGEDPKGQAPASPSPGPASG